MRSSDDEGATGGVEHVEIDAVDFAKLQAEDTRVPHDLRRVDGTWHHADVSRQDDRVGEQPGIAGAHVDDGPVGELVVRWEELVEVVVASPGREGWDVGEHIAGGEVDSRRGSCPLG
jgi:hypothetical protein